MITIQNLIEWVKALPLQTISAGLQEDLLKVLNRAAEFKVGFNLLMQMAEILFAKPLAEAIPAIEALLVSQFGDKAKVS